MVKKYKPLNIKEYLFYHIIKKRMVLTAQQIIEQSPGRLSPYETRKLEAGIRAKWAKEEAKATPKKAKARKLPKYMRGTGKTPSFSRSALALAGTLGIPTGVGPQAGISPGGKSQGRVKEGRGRPHGTYEARYLPGVGMVSMPIQAYKRALSAAKAQQRYAQELQLAKAQQAQARFAAQVPMDHTGRGMPGEFAYAEEADMDMGPEMPMEMPQEQPQGPGVAQRISNWVAQRRMARPTAGYPGGPMGMPGQPTGQITLMQGMRPAPRMGVWGTPMQSSGNILNTPNIFNNPGQTTIGIRR